MEINQEIQKRLLKKEKEEETLKKYIGLCHRQMVCPKCGRKLVERKHKPPKFFLRRWLSGIWIEDIVCTHCDYESLGFEIDLMG